MKHLLVILLLLIASISYAQTGQKYGTTANKKAKAALDEGHNIRQFAQTSDLKSMQAALDKYLEALDKDPKYLDALYSAAEMYKILQQPGNQINMIMKATGIDSTFYVPGYYNCAVALCQKDRYEEALKWFDLFEKFAKQKKTRITTDPQWKRRAYAVVNMMKNPVPFEPSYPTHYITDTDFETYWPSVTLDETELVMTTRLPIDTVAYNKDRTMIARINNNETQEDMYICRRETPEAEWKPMQPIRVINTAFNEGTQALSPDGRWMFYTACGYADSHGSCDIYFSQRTANGWTKGINVGEPVNSRSWESQPCFSADGKTLYFVRGDSKNPYRRGNIYMAEVKGLSANGVPQFGIPIALGDSINTSGDESHPFIHHDGKTLYFSSDTWPGVGGKDIFMSKRKDDGTWTTPKNIGYPINNTDDDEGLIVTANGTTGYYNSVRTVDGRRKREVRTFALYPDIMPSPVPFVTGTVTECGTQKSIDATILLDHMPAGKNVITSRTLPNGSFTAALPSEDEYLLSINAKGYFFRSIRFQATDIANHHGPIKLDTEQTCLSPLKIGAKIALRNIYFDTDKSDLKPESVVELDKLVKIMTDNPKIRIEISGHTDNRASAKHNQILSEARANATVNYCVSKGIDRKRFDIKGLGLTQPCDTNDTEEGRAMNRRIEAKIVE